MECCKCCFSSSLRQQDVNASEQKEKNRKEANLLQRRPSACFCERPWWMEVQIIVMLRSTRPMRCTANQERLMTRSLRLQDHFTLWPPFFNAWLWLQSLWKAWYAPSYPFPQTWGSVSAIGVIIPHTHEKLIAVRIWVLQHCLGFPKKKKRN